MTNTFETLEKFRRVKGAVALALIDPDLKNDEFLHKMTHGVNQAGFDAILVGGSLIMDDGFEVRMEKIREMTSLPIIIFPGSSRQLSRTADAVLFLSLHSGRNPQYLIGEQVQSAPVIYNLGIEAIPTSYLLIDGGVKSSVQVMSNTNPLPSEKHDIILAHALAGQYLGSKLVFLEAGSGARHPVPESLVKVISQKVQIPVVAGGGIRDEQTASKLVSAGAGYIVIGSLLEKCRDPFKLNSVVKSIHFLES